MTPKPLFAALLAMASVAAQTPSLLVASRFTDQILAYDTQGNFAGVFASGGGLDNPVGLTYGPDGNLYVASANTNQVLRFHGTTGAPLGVVGQVAAPRNLNFGPDGTLYVCSGSTGRIVRFTASGTSLGVFAQHAAIAGTTSLTFGPDLNLYVGSVTNSQVVKFDGRTGAMLGVFANTGMNGTHDLSFGPDGNLYVSNAFTHDVVRLHGSTGAFLGVFIADPALNFPLGITWGADGDLYLANQGVDEVRRYNGSTGALVSVFVAGGLGGLDGPLFTTFVRNPNGLQLPAPLPGVAGTSSHLGITGAQPGGVVAIGVGTLAGSLPLPWPGLVLGISDVFTLGIGVTDEGGRLVHRFFAPSAAQGIQFLFQAVDFSGAAVSGVLAHTF